MRAHAAVTVGLLALLVAGCSGTTDQPDPSAAPVTPSTPSASPSDSPVVDDVPEHEDVEPPAVPIWNDSAQGEAIARAEGFIRAWARPDLDADTWFKGVSGYLSPAAVELYFWTDPAFVPATTLTDPASIAGTPSGTSVTVEVPTDAGVQRVLLVRSEPQSPWLVAELSTIDEEPES